MFREKKAGTLSGWMMLIALPAALIAVVILFAGAIKDHDGIRAVQSAVAFVILLIALFGLTVVNPNEAVVATLFGTYLGSIKTPGFWWINPFSVKKRISLKVRNFESSKLKVNDHDGNPIEIGAVVVWRVMETAEAIFHVDDYDNFVHVQSESALRNLATSHPYDAHNDGQMSLRSHTVEIAANLKSEIQARLLQAGVEVIESRISHLAYAPEIASAMLQRQQASAIVAARTKIVEGAVGMVEMALAELSKKQIIQLDEERKAAMVSNLLVVLCSDRHTQPVINAGTLNH
ncbi:MAG: SPFH domain-containing protein [Candidatus Eisenbacteria bacterium]|nr:SPFH domain-containing protein [Candidatus Eisenbacteria bacterium]